MTDDKGAPPPASPAQPANRWTGPMIGAVCALVGALILGLINFGSTRIVSGIGSEATVSVQLTALKAAVDERNARSDRLEARIDKVLEQIGGLYTRAEAVADRVAQQNAMDAISRRIDRLESTVQEQGRVRR